MISKKNQAFCMASSRVVPLDTTHCSATSSWTNWNIGGILWIVFTSQNFKKNTLLWLILLPPASEGCWEVMFSHESVNRGRGTPIWPTRGGTPARSGWGYTHWAGLPSPPPPTPREATAEEYLIHGGRYASSVHAAGLSCCLRFSWW